MAAEHSTISRLRDEIKDCTLCADELPLGPRPVLQVNSGARILIAGQAPGSRVHKSGIPFDDPSGDRLRQWMGVDNATFYDAQKIAILPMGFCYPGTGSSGDLPPLKRCAATWRKSVLSALTEIDLTLIMGQYAMRWHLQDVKKNLTETVRAFRSYPGEVLPLPHPSPRNNRWLKANPWFEEEVLPALRSRVQKALNRS